MPLSVESLTTSSNDAEIQDRISSSIQKCMEEGGRTQKECAGMVYGMARKATGKPLDRGQ